MTQDEIGQVSDWAVKVSEEYGISVSRVTQLFKAVNKNFGADETRNIIEKGFILARGEENEPETRGV